MGGSIVTERSIEAYGECKQVTWVEVGLIVLVAVLLVPLIAVVWSRYIYWVFRNFGDKNG
jgi:hypothetical protein